MFHFSHLELIWLEWILCMMWLTDWVTIPVSQALNGIPRMQNFQCQTRKVQSKWDKFSYINEESRFIFPIDIKLIQYYLLEKDFPCLNTMRQHLIHKIVFSYSWNCFSIHISVPLIHLSVFTPILVCFNYSCFIIRQYLIESKFSCLLFFKSCTPWFFASP